jgi:hypothetical protein
MSTMRQALARAMHMADPDTAMSALNEDGFAIANQDTMSQAIHDVYCGITADHEHPNAKDREQANQVLAVLRTQGF